LVNFLLKNNINKNEIHIVLYANSQQLILDELSIIFGENKLQDYQKYCGQYYTSSAYALHLGIDILQSQTVDKKIKSILICNNLISNNLGLMLIRI
jgi:3-oxoacyl-[acyl-carrier-protein] synthase II